MRKNKFLICLGLSLFLLLTQINFASAESKVSIFKNPESNLKGLKTIYLSETDFSNVNLDDNEKSKIDLIILESLKSLPFALGGSKKNLEEKSLLSLWNGVVLKVKIQQYEWSNYWVEGYYEDYLDYEYYYDQIWVSEYDKNGKYVGKRPVTVRREYPVWRTRYIEPRYVRRAMVDATIFLEDPLNDRKIAWAYQQFRMDTKGKGGSPSPDQSLKIILKEGFKELKKLK